MLKSFKKVGEVMSRVVSKGKCFAAVLGTGLFFADAKAATDIVTHNSEGGSITWDFSSILEMMFTAVGAAIGAGVLIWVAIKGYQLMKRFLSGR